MTTNYINIYRSKFYKQFILCVNRKTEADMLEFLEKKPSYTKYIKDLIRKDMENK